MVYFVCRGVDNHRNAKFAYHVPRFTGWNFVTGATDAEDELGSGPRLAVGGGKIYLSWNNDTDAPHPELKSEMYCAMAEEPGDTWIPRLGGLGVIYYENTSGPHPRVSVYSDGKVLYLNGRRIEERFVVWNGTTWSKTRTAPWNDGFPEVVCDGKTAWVMVTSTSGSSEEVSVTGIRNPDSQPFRPQNHPPEIVTEPDTTATQDVLWTYDCDANDADGDPLTYSLVLAPASMTINDQTGLVEWTPNHDDLISDRWNRGEGVHLVGIRASDDEGSKDVQYFWLRVQQPSLSWISMR